MTGLNLLFYLALFTSELTIIILIWLDGRRK